MCIYSQWNLNGKKEWLKIITARNVFNWIGNTPRKLNKELNNNVYKLHVLTIEKAIKDLEIRLMSVFPNFLLKKDFTGKHSTIFGLIKHEVNVDYCYYILHCRSKSSLLLGRPFIQQLSTFELQPEILRRRRTHMYQMRWMPWQLTIRSMHKWCDNIKMFLQMGMDWH